MDKFIVANEYSEMLATGDTQEEAILNAGLDDGQEVGIFKLVEEGTVKSVFVPKPKAKAKKPGK